MERGIRTCTEKLNIDQGQIERILRNIEDNIKEKADSKNMVSSREVGEETLKELYPISKVAYVRFASVYREFKDVNAFMEELATFLKK